MHELTINSFGYILAFLLLSKMTDIPSGDITQLYIVSLAISPHFIPHSNISSKIHFC